MRRASGRSGAASTEEKDGSQFARDQGGQCDDERFLLPRRPPNAVRDEASSAREVQTGRASSPAREFDMAMDDSSDEKEPTQVDLGSTEKQWVSPVPVENRFQVLSGQKSVTESCD